MSTNQEVSSAVGCGCSEAKATLEAVEQSPKLEDLIPIAVVIAAGCETCAEKMVRRAVQQGSSWRNIQKTLGVVAHLQKLDCFAQAVGGEAVARMEKPLAAGRETLRQALTQQ